MHTSGPLLTRLGPADVLSWNPVREAEGEDGARFVGNFGDLLGPLLVESIVGIDAVERDPAAAAKVPVLLAVGSILHFAPRGATVWGSGVNFKLSAKVPRAVQSLDVRAVRGPHTARALTAAGARVPAIFGDPALLLPRFMPELIHWRDQGDRGLLVVPNLNDYDEVRAHMSPSAGEILDPRRPLRNVLRRIARSSLVIGSSLHAIVIADALGIPARLISSSAEGTWKYRDYLAGTGRPFTRIAGSADEAVSWGGHARPEVDLDALLAAFPHDLWSGGRPGPSSEQLDMSDHVMDRWRELLPIPLVDSGVTGRRLTDELLPAAIFSATEDMRDIGNVTGPLGEVLDDDHEESFEKAKSYRRIFAPDLDVSGMSRAGVRLVAALDDGRRNRFVRQIWLNAVGAHALLVSVRGAAGAYVISCVLRPGGLVNHLEEISVVVKDSNGLRSSFEVPVFPMYRKQWSIDVSAPVSLGRGAAPDSITISYRDSGRSYELPALRDANAENLWSFPEELSFGEFTKPNAAGGARIGVEKS